MLTVIRLKKEILLSHSLNVVQVKQEGQFCLF